MPSKRLAQSRPPNPASRPLRTRVWGAGRLLFVSVAVAVTFGAFFLTGMRVANRAREVKVPELRGQAVADANRALASVGLIMKIDQRRADSKVPADHVLGQDPDPGTVLRRQRVIRVRVSEGQRDPFVPLVTGQADRTAEIMLAEDNIQIASRASIRSASYPSGVIIAQDPPVKSRSSRVSLLVNEGEGGTGFVMPDVIGTSGGRVVDILRRHGFRVTVGAEVTYPGLPPGVVVRQSPQAGYQISSGDAVVLEVSH
ncbi:MAG: PASTA domain-containing protein [Vicinamibacterales bacterium]